MSQVTQVRWMNLIFKAGRSGRYGNEIVITMKCPQCGFIIKKNEPWRTVVCIKCGWIWGC
jgi:hypothetical protein